MNPFQLLLGGLAFIAVFLIVALPMGWLGAKLYSFLDNHATAGIFLSTVLTAYIALVVLIMMVVFGTLLGVMK